MYAPAIETDSLLTTTSILQTGKNCWRAAQASRVAMLVDGEAYFRAVRTAIAGARKSVFILGWDIDSRLRLVREADDGLPELLGPFLDAVLRRRRTLRVRVLSWDFAMIYALEREWMPVFRLNWTSHRRMRFQLDNQHPFGGSQHQKIVVVDDRIAFCGGMDLSKWRWDTPAHAADEPGRIDPDGASYGPYHDVQLLVEGEAAAALGELARGRWRTATGERLAATAAPDAPPPWPPALAVDFSNVGIGIARTQPRYNDNAEVREIEQLHVDAIAAARHSIYLENQYLTSHRVVNALAARLRESDGPEIIAVLPRETGGWLEQMTMDVLRARVLRELHEADRHRRLRVLYPQTPGLGERCISVHSKLMVIDDRLLRVGSANLSNRSMGLDSECDLAIEGSRDEVRSGIARCRNRLLAEHLGCEPAQVAAAIDREGSLLRAIEQLNTGERRLCPLDAHVDEDIDRLVPESAMIDPEKPIDADQLAREFIDEQDVEPARNSVAITVAVLLAALGLAAAWRWTPLAQWLDLQTLEALAAQAREAPLTPMVVLAGFVAGSLLVIPLTLMTVVSVLVFGPWTGGLYALCGAWLGSIAGYGAGHLLGRDAIRRLAGSRLNSLSRRLAKRGILTVIAVRLLPVAPFTVVNLVAGASHIRLRDFALGNAVGLLPGTLATAAFVDSVADAIRSPSVTELAVVGAIIGTILAAGWALRTWLRRLSAPSGSGSAGR
jgi:phospholipase D1/2